jgi:glucose-specific phosphotransferase system IIA component
MGLFNRLFGKSSDDSETSFQPEKNIVYAPVDGQAISLKEIGDGVFSEGVLGPGCGMIPESETVVSPVSGKILTVPDTKHAVGIESDDGLEILIHIGLDTVEMKGDGFTAHVKEGDQVKCGQPLISFSKKKIAAAGYKDTIAVLVTNSEDYQKVEPLAHGSVKKGTALLKAE